MKIAEAFERIAQSIASIPDHIQALAIIAAGAALSLTKQHDTAQALIAAGLAMWRGKQQA